LLRSAELIAGATAQSGRTETFAVVVRVPADVPVVDTVSYAVGVGSQHDGSFWPADETEDDPIKADTWMTDMLPMYAPSASADVQEADRHHRPPARVGAVFLDNDDFEDLPFPPSDNFIPDFNFDI